MLRSMIFSADSAMVPFRSDSSEARIAFCTSSGISAEARRISSRTEVDNRFINQNRRKCSLHCQPAGFAEDWVMLGERSRPCNLPSWLLGFFDVLSGIDLLQQSSTPQA